MADGGKPNRRRRVKGSPRWREVRERQVGGKVASSTRETEVGFNKVGRFYHLMAADFSQVLSDLTRAAGETWKADGESGGGTLGKIR